VGELVRHERALGRSTTCIPFAFYELFAAVDDAEVAVRVEAEVRSPMRNQPPGTSASAVAAALPW
jgi:hypothetical protein